jgi:hypothetical protein
VDIDGAEHSGVHVRHVISQPRRPHFWCRPAL